MNVMVTRQQSYLQDFVICAHCMHNEFSESKEFWTFGTQLTNIIKRL